LGVTHYLYDEFNDRHIHYHHTQQMFGSELATLLHHLCQCSLDEER